MRLLVANRGEIAVRVLRSARGLGWETVAVCSDADVGAVHVAAADRAVRIGPAPAARSYLDSDALLAAAKQSDAEAIHPGYGFLSENADFAEAVLRAGLVWVGPHPEAIRRMGSKAAARALAQELGVPVLPGAEAGEELGQADVEGLAAAIGFPLLVKASAGGGGKGIRVVEEAGGLAQALRAARGEAQRAFGDGRLIVERFVHPARHVEVQVAADHHGTVLHLGTRDCSVQRRHQKLVEEAPAPGLAPAVEAAMVDGAVRLAAAIGYDSLGTVEYVLDPASGEHFLLEMNTRLQVEHTVTEAVTGLDLVALQLRAAAGEPLGLAQDDVRWDGAAIQARVLAEDPDAGFLPSSGRITRYAEPPGVRVDSGVAAGTEVTSHYDPLLLKVVAHGPDRAAAAAALEAALHATVVEGVRTTLDLTAEVLGSAAFRDAAFTTRLLDDPAGTSWRAEPADAGGAALAAALHALLVADRAARARPSPWLALRDWRLLPERPVRSARYAVAHEEPLAVELTRRRAMVAGGALALPAGAERWTGQVGGGAVDVVAWLDGERLAVLDGGVVTWSAVREVDGGWVVSRPGRRAVRLDAVVAKVAGPEGVAASDGVVRSPFPGVLAEVAVAAGDQVTAGQPVATVEAMKMLHTLPAPVAGTVTAVRAAPGDQLDAGAAIAEIGTPS